MGSQTLREGRRERDLGLCAAPETPGLLPSPYHPYPLLSPSSSSFPSHGIWLGVRGHKERGRDVCVEGGGWGIAPTRVNDGGLGVLRHAPGQISLRLPLGMPHTPYPFPFQSGFGTPPIIWIWNSWGLLSA